jgi:hypothetical protein
VKGCPAVPPPHGDRPFSFSGVIIRSPIQKTLGRESSLDSIRSSTFEVMSSLSTFASSGKKQEEGTRPFMSDHEFGWGVWGISRLPSLVVYSLLYPIPFYLLHPTKHTTLHTYNMPSPPSSRNSIFRVRLNPMQQSFEVCHRILTD